MYQVNRLVLWLQPSKSIYIHTKLKGAGYPVNFNDIVAQFRAKYMNAYSSFASWEKLERIVHKVEEQFYFIFFVMSILISEVWI